MHANIVSDTFVFNQMLGASPGKSKILAEGDSWFGFPRKYLLHTVGSSIIDHLAQKNDLIIFSRGNEEDDVAAMLSGEKKLGLLKRLKYLDFTYFLFSGGLNDIIGRYVFGFLLEKQIEGSSWRSCVQEDRLSLKLNQVMAVYEEMIIRVTQIKPSIKIITHTYDFPLPSSKGTDIFDIFQTEGPWLSSYLLEKKIVKRENQIHIIRYILERYKEMLFSLHAKYPSNFKVVDTQGTLKESDWENEMHPTVEGFEKLAKVIYLKGIRGGIR